MSTIAAQDQLAAARPHRELPPPSGYIAAGEPEGLGLADVMRILKQRRMTIIVTAMLTYILVGVATFVTWKYFPAYSSEAIFELLPPRGPGLNPPEGDVNPLVMEQMLQTEANKLRGLSLLLWVAQQPSMKTTDYYQWYKSDARQCAVGLQEDLVAQPIPDTRLIRVGLSCRNREEARDIVKLVSQRYLDAYKLETEEDRFKRHKTLKDLLSELTKQLDDKRSELAAQRQRGEVPALEAAREASSAYISKLRSDLSVIDASAAGIQAQINSLAGYDPSLLPLNAEHQLIIESDPILRFYRSQVETMDIEIRARALTLGENHRDVQTLKERRAGYYDKEVAKREELITQVRTRQVESLRDNLSSARSQQLRFQELLQAAEAEQGDLDHNIQIYQQLSEDKDRLGKQIERVETDLKDAESALKDESRVRLRMVQSPELAVAPSRPQLKAYLAGGLLLALAAGVGLAFVRELTDKRIRTPIDVARFGHISVLGAVPLLDDEEVAVETIEQVVRVAPHSLLADAYRKISTNLQFSGPAETQRSLLVTSPSPGDGKTAAAINLATTMAHGNQRVLLVDCNFRRPAIRALIPDTRPEGLSNVLTGQAKVEDVVTHTDLPNLDVLSSGPMPPRPSELLGSKQMRELLGTLASRYDRIILDGPPALLISDAIVLANLVDGVILVARAESNSKGALKRAREQLEGVNARIFGAILNGVRVRSGGYFKQQYREFYEYTSDETVPSELPGLPPARPNELKG